MQLYPAIDIFGGTVVRLMQGDFDQATEYGSDPASIATEFVRQGATALHVVDLDGARAGQPANLDSVAEIVRQVQVPVQLGGGLRTPASIESALDSGVDRIIMGTVALTDRALLEETLARVGPDRLVVSVDYRDNQVATQGWLEAGEVSPEGLVIELEAIGVETVLCTMIETDGTMGGPDLAGLNRIADRTDVSLIASGGVGSLEDLVKLEEGTPGNVAGVIVGRAFYQGKFTVAEAMEALAGR